jgi:mono/diheme cytochrome c family protein
MRKRRWRRRFGASVAVAAGLAGGAAAADVERGAAIAARWCANCHAVGPAVRRSDADPPAFAQIGRQPDLDAGKLRAFLMTPHPRMPDMALTRQEIEDLVAFIRSEVR